DGPGELPGQLHHRAGQGDPVLRAAGRDPPRGAAAVRDPGQLVDPQGPRGVGGVAGVAAGRAGVAADVRAVAEPDREAVALAEAGCPEDAPIGRRLEDAAWPGAVVPGAVRPRLAALAGVRRPARQRADRPGDSWHVVTEFNGQSS